MLSLSAPRSSAPQAPCAAVRLTQNESAFGPSPAALLAAASVPADRYPDPDARRLREALARHHGRSPDEVCATAGASEAIRLLVAAVPGCVIVPAGSFPLYAKAAKQAGRAVCITARDLGYRVDLQAISQAITPMAYTSATTENAPSGAM
jgi:histidinol-phosphate aminotransferase